MTVSASPVPARALLTPDNHMLLMIDFQSFWGALGCSCWAF